MTLFALDIETDTTVNGLDPNVSAVISAAVVSSEGHTLVLDSDDETGLLSELFFFFDEHLSSEDTLVSWNGSVFDFPFIHSRALAVGFDCPFSLEFSDVVVPKYDPTPGYVGGYDVVWNGATHVDVAYAYREFSFSSGVSWSLKPVARYLNLDPVEVDASEVSELSEKERREYVLSDAFVTLRLFQKLDVL